MMDCAICSHSKAKFLRMRLRSASEAGSLFALNLGTPYCSPKDDPHNLFLRLATPSLRSRPCCELRHPAPGGALRRTVECASLESRASSLSPAVLCATICTLT